MTGRRRVDASRLTGPRHHSQHSSGTTVPPLAWVPYKTAWICGQGSSDSSWFSQELDEEGE
uniref:Uncharacterized protein n=1 Tax=Arundo donax TaxID=35708 RepID=A0A0A8ZYB4_ARUDO